ncbi:MAG: 2-isopropylmalate synthase [Candidatus Altiarchaeota archaeon]|nr:2-isopropylmalate synthase [Candidatus Altiarchaeota archaeon]
MTRKIKVLDTTLRDGEQTPGVSLTPNRKLEIAKVLDDLGVDVIEAGTAIASDGEKEGMRLIAKQGLKAEVLSFARILQKDIDAAMECGVDGIFLVAPTSDLHIKYKLNSTRDEVLKKVEECVQYCRKHGLVVDLCTEDGSRSDLKFLLKVRNLAAELKADRFTLADTVGVMTPEKMSVLVSRLVDKSKIPVGIHCHDDFGMATANTLAAVVAGASMVDVTVNGLGERAGNACLDEVVVGLKLLYGFNVGVDPKKILSVSEFVEKTCGIPVPPNKAVIGENAFTHEAGIHVDGILKKPETYEPISPDFLGAKRTFVLGKHAGLKAVKKILEDEGFKMNDDQVSEVFRQVKYLGDKGKHVTSVDLESIANTVLGLEHKRALKLEELVAVAGNKFTPTASVKLRINGIEVLSAGTGTGPVDAAINAIKAATKDVPFELVEYHVDAISGGTDAVVKILVKLKTKDRIVTAEGVGSDIILASVDAMVNGLNSIMVHSK